VDGVTALLTPLLLVGVAAAVAAAAVVLLLARKGRRDKREVAAVKWSALADRRGLIVEAQGPASSEVVAYCVQAVRVLEEVGRVAEVRARLGDLTLEIVPEGEGLYRVVAR